MRHNLRALFLVLVLGIAVALWTCPSFAGQLVLMSASENGTALTIDAALNHALGQEVQSIVSAPLPAPRLAQVVAVLAPERGSLILGYSEVAAGNSTASASGNATVPGPANATDGGRSLDVRVQSEAVRNRLRDLGVLFTAQTPLPYVLRLSDVEPSRTKALGPLQDMSGLHPVPTAGEDVPVLTLSQFGAWTGELSKGNWKCSHTAKALSEVWLFVWKAYFNQQQAGMRVQGEAGLLVRVSGWLSSQGPLEFDRLMDSWTAEIGQKTLVEVTMQEGGMSGAWRIQTKARDALVHRLGDATAAQGLTLDVR